MLASKQLQLFVLGVFYTCSAIAQQVGFTVFPTQVLTGGTYTISWNSNGQPVTLQLLHAGAVEDVLFQSADGATNTFQWTVEDDYDGGTDYTLVLSTAAGTVGSSNVWVIEDEDGLVVSGTTLFAPQATATAVTAAATAPETAATTVASIASSAISTPGQTATNTVVSASAIPTSTADGSSSMGGGGLGAGPIVGIVLGVLAVVALSVFCCCVKPRRDRKKAALDAENGTKFDADHNGVTAAMMAAKGPPPTYSEVKQEGHVDGEVAKQMGNKHDSAELHGNSHIPWNEMDGGPSPSVINGTFEADSNTQHSSVVHELPADTSRHT